MTDKDLNKVKTYIQQTYTPEAYYKLWLYMYYMLGEGYIAAESLFEQITPNEEVFDYNIDKLANDLVKELEGD